MALLVVGFLMVTSCKTMNTTIRNSNLESLKGIPPNVPSNKNSKMRTKNFLSKRVFHKALSNNFSPAS